MDKVLSVISRTANVNVDDIDIDDSLLSLGIDSLMIVGLIINIEEEFGIVFDDAKLDPEKLNTVRSVINLVENHCD